MKRIALLLTAGILLFGYSASAQPAAEDGKAVKVLSYQSTRVGENINLEFLINYDKVILNPNEELTITPFIVGESDTLYLRPVVLVGERCYKTNQRNNTLNGMSPSRMSPYETVVMTRDDIREMRRQQRDNPASWSVNSNNTVRYSTAFPYQTWMDGSQVKMNRILSGCKGEEFRYTTLIGTLYNPMPPQVMFIVPDVEVVKARSETMTARVVFEVNKTDIKRNMFNNATEIDRIYGFTDRIVNNEDVNITSIHLKGYASPEGNYRHNTNLSIGRVNALRTVLQDRYKSVNNSLYRTENIPEDWDSVRRWAASSDHRFRSQIIDIIDTTPDPDARDAKIRRLDGSATYNMLLREVYPGLRRTEYTIHYTVMPFTVEKGKQVILTNPQHLSLNELYQIAITYPIDSPQYREVFETAIRYYPNDPVALNNMAAMALQNNDIQLARTYLDRVGNFAGSQNNLGVLNALEGNYEAAEAHFRRAAAAGSREAEYNMQNLHSLRVR